MEDSLLVVYLPQKGGFMSYTCKYLQFGTEKPIQGFDELTLDSSETPAPAYKILVDPVTKELWDLYFACQFDKTGTTFFTPSQQVPGGAEAKVKAWYNKEGGNGSGHYLTIMPFLITDEFTGFPKDPFIVKFSVPGGTEKSINTDDILMPSVTAEVPAQLRLAKISMHGENNGILITTTVDAFDHYEPLIMDKGTVIDGTKITVKKGHSCVVLAVYAEKVTTHFKPIRTRPNKDIMPEIGIDILKDLMAKQTINVMPDLSFKVTGLKDIKGAEKMIVSVIEAHAPVLN